MAFKKPIAQASAPDSPDKLFLDLPRRKYPSLFDHQGQVLRTYAREAHEASDVALQLPTGSGKTLVGLLLAEWRRRKDKERVVYLCPTRQLVNQVAEEANSKYGLNVQPFTGSVRNYTPEAKTAYSSAERVAITTYSSLFNINPFFRNPDVIIVDDAHAAEAYIASPWTLRILRYSESDSSLFKAVVEAIKPAINPTNYARLTETIEAFSDKLWVDKLPTDKLVELAPEISSAISANIEDSDGRYAWPFLQDHLDGCQLYISASEILLRPLIPPTWTHKPFDGASQRVFMSATLGAGGDLERITGRSSIQRLPIPEGWDRQGIGRRFFMFPEASLPQEGVEKLRRALMRTARRSLILTPSFESADALRTEIKKHLKCPTYSADDLEESRATFTTSERAVAVIANRYDGIDFPNDDCRLLFIEGLPRATNLQERFVMNRMGAHLMYNERIQTRVLQAIGRCTRGLNDYSAVVVTGEELPDYLNEPKRRKFLHPELQAELEFGIQQSSDVTENDFLENFKIFLAHAEEWEDANQQILDFRAEASQAAFPAMDHLAASSQHEIAYQAAMWRGDYALALDAAREVLAELTGEGLRGYRALWHYLAGSAAELAVGDGDTALDSQAREQFRRAKEYADGIPWLVGLARFRGLTAKLEQSNSDATLLQVERLEARLARLGMLHNRKFSVEEREIREGLKTADTFEEAQVRLGEHLGFIAGKREVDASPDPWWIIGNICFVFEDHAGADASAYIDAKKARQAASHPDWVKENVPGASEAEILPVLVTPTSKAKEGAIPTLKRVAYWPLPEFLDWADRSLATVRDLRRTFTEPGDLEWRAKAATALVNCGADATGLLSSLTARRAADAMQVIR